MRKLEVQDLRDVRLGTMPIIPPIEKIADIDRVLPAVTPEERAWLVQGCVALVDEPEKFKARPKIAIDFDNGIAYGVQFQVDKAAAGRIPQATADGLSMAVRVADGKALAIERSLQNKSCKGFVGTPAGILVVPYLDYQNRLFPTQIDLQELIAANVREQLEHELGISSSSYSWQLVARVSVDYPTVQNEFIVLVDVHLSSEEVLEAVAANVGTPTGLAEKSAFILSRNDVFDIIALDLPTATQHIYALAVATGDIEDKMLESIKRMSCPDPSIEAPEEDRLSAIFG